MTEKTKNYFEELNEINVSDKIEKKNNLSYLSWAWAWGELKKRYPAAKKAVIKNEQGWLYHTDGKTCWVEVSVTINDVEETEYLPVMDFKNQAIPLERVTSTAVNTTIQRAVTKAIARHGLGLYIYAGEDLPESEEKLEKKEAKRNAFGLSKDGDLASGAEMTETFNEMDAKFETIKTYILNRGSIAELEAACDEKRPEVMALNKSLQGKIAKVKAEEIARIKGE